MKKTTRKALAAVAAITLAAGLTACAIPGERLVEPSDSLGSVSNGAGEISLYETSITLEDGREVTCVVAVGYYKGGASCDWEATR